MENCIEKMQRIGGKDRVAAFMVKQKQDYAFKVRYAAVIARDFVQQCGMRGMNCHVSVGGLDSITLYIFLREQGIKVPGISVSHLEDRSIQAVHRQLGIECLKPAVRCVATR